VSPGFVCTRTKDKTLAVVGETVILSETGRLTSRLDGSFCCAF
jgi:hypothetical protein